MSGKARKQGRMLPTPDLFDEVVAFETGDAAIPDEIEENSQFRSFASQFVERNALYSRASHIKEYYFEEEESEDNMGGKRINTPYLYCEPSETPPPQAQEFSVRLQPLP